MPPRCGGRLADRPACLLAVDEPECDSEDDEEAALLRPDERSPASGGLLARVGARAPVGATRALLLCGAFVGTLMVLPAPGGPGRTAAGAPGDVPALPHRGPLEANAGEAILASGAVPGILGGLPLGAANASCDVHPQCANQSLHGLCCPNNVMGQMLSCCNASGSQANVSAEPAQGPAADAASAGDDGGAAELGVEAPPGAPAEVVALLAAANVTTTAPAGAAEEESTSSLTTTTEVGFECSLDDETWETGWSAKKKAWCCEHQQVHCEVTQTTVTDNLAPSSYTIWGIICGSIYCQSDAVCCSNLNGGALCGVPGSTCCAGRSLLLGGDAPLVLCANNSQCCNGVCLAAPAPGASPTPCLPVHDDNSTSP